MRGNRSEVRAALSYVEPYVSVPWNIDTLINRLAAARGRAIELVPWKFPKGTKDPSGLWIPSLRADYIFYDRAASISPERRDQIIGHELGHVLCDHQPRLQDAPPGVLEALAPSLSPGLSRRILAMSRDGYEEFHEATAEEFGTKLSRLGRTKRRPSGANELGRLTDSLT